MEFQPTHEITLNDLRDGVVADRILVRLVDGAAYTQEEWDSNSAADWEVVDDEWRFQGRVSPGPFAVSVKRLGRDSEIVALAESCAAEAIEQGARAPWGDGAMLPGDTDALADLLGRGPTHAEETTFRDAFCAAIDELGDESPEDAS